MRLITLIKDVHRATPDQMPWRELTADRCLCEMPDGARLEAARGPDGVRLQATPGGRSCFYPAFDATLPTYAQAWDAFEGVFRAALEQSPDLKQEALWRLQVRTQLDKINKNGTKRQKDQARKTALAVSSGGVDYETATRRLLQIERQGF